MSSDVTPAPSKKTMRLNPFSAVGIGLLVVAAIVLMMASPAMAPAPSLPDVRTT